MPDASSQERTEKATPKRRQEAKKKGQVAKSSELPSVLIFFAALTVFYFAGSWMYWNFHALFTEFYQQLASLRIETVVDAGALSAAVLEKIFSLLIIILPPILIAGFIANVSQVGFGMYSESLKPKLSKLNPVSGFKQFVSLKSLVELCKSLVKLSIIGCLSYFLIKAEMQHMPALVLQEVGDIFLFIVRVAFKLIFFVTLAMVVLAVLDIFYQRWQLEKDLKMTKQEVKDERKQAEGDPKVKGRIRKAQLEMAQRRMMAAVPEADVVITNPTHLAVALKFDAAEMIAPQVLAKGAGTVAEKIREVALAHQIPIVEDKPLAQTLHKMVEIGDMIPVELYRAVAEVLAYVYRLKGLHRTA